jgi:hypothetical protein
MTVLNGSIIQNEFCQISNDYKIKLSDSVLDNE